MIKKIYIIAIILILSTSAWAQDHVTLAIQLLQSEEVDKARLEIDTAIRKAATMNDPETWYVRGFVYKNYYLKYEKPQHIRNLTTRLESMRSFKKSMELDKKGEKLDENRKNLKVLATYLYNDAASSLDTVHYKYAIQCFENYKIAAMLSDSSSNFMRKEIEFKNTLATQYTKLYDNDKSKRADFLQKAKDSYLQVLKMEENNMNANYNLGTLYYNQAVNMINAMDPDIDIVALNQLQDNTISIFKESLPYMLKAYEIDPAKEAILIGLSGIYFSLNDEEQSNYYKNKLEEIQKEKIR
jgi:hypothetical protein